MRKRYAKCCVVALSCSVLTHSHRLLNNPKKNIKRGGGGSFSRLSFLDVPFGTPLVCDAWGLFDYCWVPFLLAQSLPETPIALCAIRFPY